MSELVFVHDRFAWERESFSSWEEIFPVNSVLLPYRGGIAPVLVGDEKNVWEVHKSCDTKKLHSPLEYIYRGTDAYQVYKGNFCLAQCCTIEECVTFLQKSNDKVPELIPQYIYHKPAGRLLKILNDPESVLILLCGWKKFRREGNELKELNTVQRDQFAGFLSLPYWTMKNHHRDQKMRTECARFPFKEEIIEIRTEKFSVNSLHYDSVVHVLSPECAKDPAAVEFFKNQMLTLAEQYDLDAIFVKEKQDRYALGCRHEEFLGEYHNYQVRQLANYREKDLFLNMTVQEAVFEFLDKIKNDQYVVMHHDSSYNRTEWLDEGLPRPNFLLGGMMRAMVYYSEASFMYRRQWGRIERNKMEKNHE